MTNHKAWRKQAAVCSTALVGATFAIAASFSLCACSSQPSVQEAASASENRGPIVATPSSDGLPSASSASWDESGHIPVGTAAALSNDPSSATQDVMWDGTMEVAVDSATLYGSPEEAATAENLGTVVDQRDRSEHRILVVRMTFHNVDAISRLAAPESGKGAYEFFSTLFQPKFVTESGEVAFAGVIYSFDGAPEGTDPTSQSASNFVLEPGKTATYTLGFWLDGPFEPDDLFISPASWGMGRFVFDLGLPGDQETGSSRGTSESGGGVAASR